MVFLAGPLAAATRLLGQRQQSRQKRQILNVAADANVAAVPTTADTIPSPSSLRTYSRPVASLPKLLPHSFPGGPVFPRNFTLVKSVPDWVM